MPFLCFIPDGERENARVPVNLIERDKLGLVSNVT